MIVIGIDQSLAQPGLAAIERVRGVWRVRELASFATTSEGGGLTSIEDARRVCELVAGVEAFLLRHQAPARSVVVELLSGRARSHRADRTMSLAYGAVTTLCSLLGVQPTYVSAHDAKKHATGNAMAEKHEVVAAMAKRWGWAPEVAARGETVRVQRESEAKADALALATWSADRIDARDRRAA